MFKKGDTAIMLEFRTYGAKNLYDGGWRSTDRAELMERYSLTDEDADMICEALDEIEKKSSGSWKLWCKKSV